MGSVEHAIEIVAQIDSVFLALTDPRRGSEWNPNIIDVSDISDALIRAGTTWKQKAILLGRPENFDCRITEYDPPDSGVLQISGAHRATITTHCESKGEGTLVRQRMEFEVPGGFLGRLAGRFLGERLKRELVETMDRQRVALEREANDGFETA